jgi:glycosyltransferase involved in cell wall biosynthesis
LLVLLSHPTEGLPTVILESMACGTPVLATPVAGVPDVVGTCETGFLTHGKDSKTLATEIEHILELESLPEIGEKARTLVESEYSFEAALERYKDILASINGKRSHR